MRSNRPVRQKETEGSGDGHNTVASKLIKDHHPLLGKGETNGVPLKVIDRVVTTEEDITYTHHSERKNQNLLGGKLTDDPKGASGKVDIHAGERRDTSTLNLKNVVGGLDGVRLAIEGESEIRQAGDGRTINGVLTIPATLSTNLSVDHLSNISREGNQGGTYSE